MHVCAFAQGSLHASLTSSSKMAAISSALLAAAASEEEESAERILERHMSLVFSGPDTEAAAFACHSAGKSPGQHRGPRVALSSDCPAAHHMKSSSLTHSQSAADGHWSSSDHWSLSDHCPPAFRTSASFGDGDLLHSKFYQPHSSGLNRCDHERTVAQVHSVTAVSKHHQHLLSCPHTDAERK